VAIDDATAARYGRYPLPRQAYADLLTALTPLAPRTVALDVAFYDESPDPAQDRSLAAAIRNAGNVVLAMQGSGSSIPHDGAMAYRAESLPIPLLRAAAAALGSVNLIPDDDARVRNVQLVIETPSGRYYALPLVATARSMAVALQTAGDERAITRTAHSLVLPGRPGLGDRVIPISASGASPVYYATPPATDLADQRGRTAPWHDRRRAVRRIARRCRDRERAARAHREPHGLRRSALALGRSGQLPGAEQVRSGRCSASRSGRMPPRRCTRTASRSCARMP